MAAGKDLYMGRILLVDDDTIPTGWIASFLASAGHEVHTAQNSYQARELQSNMLFDLILVDSIMPGREGLNLVREFRTKNIDTPMVLMVSTRGTHLDQEVEVLTSGNLIQGVCDKAWMEHDLPSILTRILN